LIVWLRNFGFRPDENVQIHSIPEPGIPKYLSRFPNSKKVIVARFRSVAASPGTINNYRVAAMLGLQLTSNEIDFVIAHYGTKKYTAARTA